MSTPPLPSPPPPKPIGLARLATILAVAFAIAFGLCTVGVMRNFNNPGILVYFSLVVEAICAVGLLVVAIIAIIRAVKSRNL